MPARSSQRKGPSPNRPNRGPAAAAANRAALIEAGRELFSREGYAVPMSAIARTAGVGQGVLYRHFPTRIELALAVFSDNIDDLERAASNDPSPRAFLTLWQRLVHQTVEGQAVGDL